MLQVCQDLRDEADELDAFLLGNASFEPQQVREPPRPRLRHGLGDHQQQLAQRHVVDDIRSCSFANLTSNGGSSDRTMGRCATTSALDRPAPDIHH